MLGEICQKGISIVDIMVVTRNIEFYFFNFKTNNYLHLTTNSLTISIILNMQNRSQKHRISAIFYAR